MLVLTTLFAAAFSMAAPPPMTSNLYYPVPAKFQPESGKTLLILGQDLTAISDYDRYGRLPPFGYTEYTALKNLEGLTSFSDVGGGPMDAEKVHRDHPGAGLQLGLNVVGDLDSVVAGKRDDNIRRLSAFLVGLHVPVLLRFGYEFDYPGNHYEPALYKAAFRHFVDVMRQEDTSNIAFVWHSYADKRPLPLDAWYPGDEYVDWCAISLFELGHPEQIEMANFAKRHGKPLMIAESAPWRIPAPRSWESWFQPVLHFIRAQDVAAWCYINCNWDSIPIFKNENWGDSRLSASPEVLRKWNRLAHDPRFSR